MHPLETGYMLMMLAQQLQQRFGLIQWCKLLFFKSVFWSHGFQWLAICRTSFTEQVYVYLMLFFTFRNKSPSTSVVEENVSTQFCFEAAEMVCGLWNFTCLPISNRVSKKWMHFHFWLNLYFKEIVMGIFAIRLFEMKRKWSFQSFYHCLISLLCIFRVHLFTKISQDTLTLPTHEKITAVKKQSSLRSPMMRPTIVLR